MDTFGRRATGKEQARAQAYLLSRASTGSAYHGYNKASAEKEVARIVEQADAEVSRQVERSMQAILELQRDEEAKAAALLAQKTAEAETEARERAIEAQKAAAVEAIVESARAAEKERGKS